MSTVEQMESQIAELRRQLTIQRDQNAARNRLLDLLGMCWCDGGCTKGMHRFYEGEPTAADIAALQVNAARARAWFVNRAFRLADHHPTAARIAHAAIDAAMPPAYRTRPLVAAAENDVLHPFGHCSCFGEGTCQRCVAIGREVETDTPHLRIVPGSE